MDYDHILNDKEKGTSMTELKVPDFYFEDRGPLNRLPVQREGWGAGIKATTLDVKPNDVDNVILRMNIGLVGDIMRCQILIEGELDGDYFEISGPPQSSYEEAVASFIDHIRKLEGFGFEHGIINRED